MRSNCGPIRDSGRVLLAIVAFAALITSSKVSPASVSADSGDVFGPACGAVTIDSVVDPTEWQNASTRTVQMVKGGGADPFTATLHVMNSGGYLYMGITINDDEFSTVGQWLPHGDGFRIDFDNDYSGTLFAPGDDVLSIAAGSPQFGDSYLDPVPESPQRAHSDVQDGGTTDGMGAASRVGELNHFELRHPLCSGDSRDFCLQPDPDDVVGFRLEYLDAEADGSFGGDRFFPPFDSTSEAAIVVGPCSIPDFFTYLPLIRK